MSHVASEAWRASQPEKLCTCLGERFAAQQCVLKDLYGCVAMLQEAASVVKDKTKARCASLPSTLSACWAVWADAVLKMANSPGL